MMTDKDKVELVKRRYKAAMILAEFGITPVEREHGEQDLTLLDMLVDAEARADRAEFYFVHRMKHFYCVKCRDLIQGVVDPRHTWTPEQWRAAVRARYGKEEKS